MITATINPKNDKYIVSFIVFAQRPDLAPIEFYANAVKDTQQAAQSWTITQYKLFLKNEVKKFVSMRENALMRVGMLNQAYIEIFNMLKKIKDCPSLTTVCLFIVQNQDYLRALVPSKNSAQYYLTYTIEEIITGAYEYAMLNKNPVSNYDGVH